MRLKFSVSFLTMLVISAGICQAGTSPVEVIPSVASPGQTVTFRWFFTGTKVVVSGGRFKKGMVVTGKTRLTDAPLVSTNYAFDVWYPNPTGAAPTVLHRHYVVPVEVESALTAYKDSCGWQIGYRKGWRFDRVPLADPTRNALVFFQQEEDSLERLAVSILPAGGMSLKALTEKVQSDLPTHYDRVQVLTQTDTFQEGEPAILTTFTGLDLSHPGSRIQSIVLTYIKDDRAFVVSVRTNASLYANRQKLMNKMVRSISGGESNRSASRKGL